MTFFFSSQLKRAFVHFSTLLFVIHVTNLESFTQPCLKRVKIFLRRRSSLAAHLMCVAIHRCNSNLAPSLLDSFTSRIGARRASTSFVDGYDTAGVAINVNKGDIRPINAIFISEQKDRAVVTWLHVRLHFRRFLLRCQAQTENGDAHANAAANTKTRFFARRICSH